MRFFGLGFYVNIFLYLDPRPWPKGANEIGSICPHVRPEFFSELAYWFFVKLDKVLKDPYMVVYDSLIFWKKYYCAKC